MFAGAFKAMPATMASGGTLSAAIDLGGSYDVAYLEIPTMVSGTAYAIQAATEITGTYRRVKHPSLNSSTVATNDFLIASSATNCLVPIPSGLRYLKVETTATVDNGALFKVVYGI